MKRLFLTALTVSFLFIPKDVFGGPSETKSFKIAVTIPPIATTTNIAVQDPLIQTSKTTVSAVIIEQRVRDNEPVIIKSFVVK